MHTLSLPMLNKSRPNVTVPTILLICISKLFLISTNLEVTLFAICCDAFTRNRPANKNKIILQHSIPCILTLLNRSADTAQPPLDQPLCRELYHNRVGPLIIYMYRGAAEVRRPTYFPMYFV